ncbi:MAG: four-carbon acid sugar kinase family protein [Planctomycetes bacterium]|nr:four-carbon acid sugar kinase family protein [Planctomycetota bacterium]
MASTTPTDLLLGFYGDDFTGSTDAMEALTRAGLRTVLFIGRPRPEQLHKYAGLRAIGLAGCSRSLSPEEMDAELGEALGTLKEFRLPIVHYKVCSTFDSSPRIGSVGRALDIGAELFGTPVVPLLVGAPILGRYCVFGNLFARSGLDSEPYRLDRHPTMSRHPITPMTESDLRLHLAAQTQRRVRLLDVLSITDVGSARTRYQELVKAGAEAVLIDVLYREQEATIGALLADQVRPGSTLFVVGSSGVEYCLTAHWHSQGRTPPPPAWTASPADKMLVVSGSCSPVTDRQIAWAVERGAVEVPVRTDDLVDPGTAEAQIEAAATAGLAGCQAGRTVICHTARGPSDPRRAETAARFERAGGDARQLSARVLGAALGRIMLRVLQRGGLRRAVVAGGDTSFHVARTLGIEALEMAAPAAPGSPLCRAHIPGSPLDGIEVCFKGGQVGRDSLLGDLANLRQ